MEDRVPKGPLAARWHGLELPALRAGALAEALVRVENAGTATWRSTADGGVRVSYHWLDERGNPIVWDGVRTLLERPVGPGELVETALPLRAPLPPGRYRLAVDLVDEGRLWFAEVGNSPVEAECAVGPRIPRALAARGGDAEALASQEEPLVPEDEAAAVAFLADGVAPAPDWSRRVLDAHQEGYAVVAGSVEAARGLLRRAPRELEPYAPGPGRVPGFPYPLVCPSVAAGVGPDWADAVAGLPAVHAPGEEPWVYDGRIRITVRASRRRG